jgi:hypothetical protein
MRDECWDLETAVCSAVCCSTHPFPCLSNPTNGTTLCIVNTASVISDSVLKKKKKGIISRINLNGEWTHLKVPPTSNGHHLKCQSYNKQLLKR